MNFVTANQLYHRSLNYFKTFYAVLKKYCDLIMEYEKKVKQIFDSFLKNPLFGQHSEKNLSSSDREFHRIITMMTDTFGKVLQSKLEGNKEIIIGLNNLQDGLNTILAEKKKEHSNYVRDFQDASNDLKTFYKKVGVKKTEFFKAAENAEDSLEKICKFRNSSENSKEKSSFKSEYNKAAQDADKYLLSLKDKYTDYRKVVANSKSIEDTFTLRVSTSLTCLNNLTVSILEELKKSAIYFSVLEKTCCGKINMEIETFFPNLDNIEAQTVFSTYFANHSITNLPLNPMTVKKYQPKILNKFYKTKNNIDFDEKIASNNEFIIESQSNIIEESSNIPFENVHYIVEKLYKSIHRGLDDQYDVELEKKKFTLYKLCHKFLIPEKSSLSNEELIQLNELMKIRELRKFFLQNLNLLRNKGYFKIFKENHQIIGKFLNMVLNFLEIEKVDFYCARGVIILSQTFYYIDDETQGKVYLQESIRNNKILKEKSFWEQFIASSIEDGLKHNPKGNNRKSSNNELETVDNVPNLKETEEDVITLANVAFGQLISITDNMKEFGIDKGIIREIEAPFMDRYKISKENQEAIFSLI